MTQTLTFLKHYRRNKKSAATTGIGNVDNPLTNIVPLISLLVEKKAVLGRLPEVERLPYDSLLIRSSSHGDGLVTYRPVSRLRGTIFLLSFSKTEIRRGSLLSNFIVYIE